MRGLYAITPQLEDTALLAARVAAALEGGAAAIQYRAKGVEAARALEQARRLQSLTQSHGVPLIVNDSVQLAAAIGAEGVHLGRDDGDPRAARALLPDALIGVSCYNEPARARAAAEAGADYIAIGSMFASGTKPAAVRATLEHVAQARAWSGLPVVAIGGITTQNARAVIDAGADMVAVIAALFDGPDVTGAARAFAQLFEPPRAGPTDARTQP